MIAVVYSKHVTDLRSLFQAADREQQGALERERVEVAFSKLDLGFSPAQLTALIETLWSAAPMTPRRGSRGAQQLVTEDVVTEEEFVEWGARTHTIPSTMRPPWIFLRDCMRSQDPKRAELAAFMLRRYAPAGRVATASLAEGVPLPR